MANDFFKEEPKEEKIEAPEKFKVGEKEYSQDELSELVGLGEIGREAEKKFNTKLDKVWPKFGEMKNREKELEAQLEELKAKKEEAPQNELSQESISQAREAAKKIGIVTEDQFDNYLDKRFRSKYLQERAAERLIEDCEDFEKKFDGKDGRPAFKKEEILNHMMETGIKDPELAYKTKFETEIDAWKEQQFGSMKKPGITTQTESTGMKLPEPRKITDSNLRSALEESLYPSRG